MLGRPVSLITPSCRTRSYTWSSTPAAAPVRCRRPGADAGSKGARSTKAIVPRTAAIPLGETLRAAAHPLTGSAGDYDPLMELIGDARIVLLGEASHGTHEFYRERARITQRLIEGHGFTVVAVEADWPDAYRVNRWVRGTGSDTVAA